MPSFVCDRCQETLKKAKLDSHKQYCRQASFSCIDCYKSFKGDEYRAHTSCITEVQKYHGKPAVPKVPKVSEVSKVEQKEEPKVSKEELKAEAPAAKKQKNDDSLSTLLKKSLCEPKTLKELKKIVEEKDLKKDFERRLQFTINPQGDICVSILQ